MTVTEAERIDDRDLERHQWLAAKLEAAAQAYATASGAWRMWVEELHERYELATDGSEGVDPDGTIRRAIP